MQSQAYSDHPACLLSRLDAHLQVRLTEVLIPLGIQPRHFGLLSLLREQDGLSQHQLCGPLSVHRNVMVGLVDELEQRGLIERRRHPDDRRAHALHLLPAGRKLQAQAEKLVTAFEVALLAGLDAPQTQTFVSTLKRICDNADLLQAIHPGLTAPPADST